MLSLKPFRMRSASKFPTQVLTLLLRLLHLRDLGIKQTIAWSSVPGFWTAFREQQLDFLQGLLRRFRVEQESLDGRTEIEDPKNDESLPANVMEGRGDEETKSEIEEPIRVDLDANS